MKGTIPLGTAKRCNIQIKRCENRTDPPQQRTDPQKLRTDAPKQRTDPQKQRTDPLTAHYLWKKKHVCECTGAFTPPSQTRSSAPLSVPATLKSTYLTYFLRRI